MSTVNGSHPCPIISRRIRVWRNRVCVRITASLEISPSRVVDGEEVQKSNHRSIVVVAEGFYSLAMATASAKEKVAKEAAWLVARHRRK